MENALKTIQAVKTIEIQSQVLNIVINTLNQHVQPVEPLKLITGVTKWFIDFIQQRNEGF